jgi:hypothetical protein
MVLIIIAWYAITEYKINPIPPIRRVLEVEGHNQ